MKTENLSDLTTRRALDAAIARALRNTDTLREANHEIVRLLQSLGLESAAFEAERAWERFTTPPGEEDK